MGKIIEASDSVSIGQQMKVILQREAQDKANAARRAQQSDKMASIIKVVIETLAEEPNQAIEVVLSYACALAISTDTPKERLLEGVGKVFDQQKDGYDKMVAAQKQAMLGTALAAMAQKQPLHPALIQQLEGMKVEMPQELQDYIADQKGPTPKPDLKAMPDAPPEETKATEEEPAKTETPETLPN